MKMNKEKMFEAEMVHHQLEQVQSNLQNLDKQMADVVAMKEALHTFKTINAEDELLVPVAAGVFMKAKATGEHTLRVNVGQGVTVDKTPEQVQEMLDEQMTEMRNYEEQMHKQFDELLAKLQNLEQELRKA
jgi:prefoldin alpha subunit